MAGGTSAAQKPRKTPKKGRQIFGVGSTVEVLTEEQDYGGVFYAATVVESTPASQKGGGKKNSKGNKMRVEYRDLVVEEGGSEHLREYVDASSVRPVPPERAEGSFAVGQLVDAFYNDGWWTGVVTQMVEGGGRENLRVIVTFPHPPDVREFGTSELRTHLKWADGQWVTPEKQDVPVLSYIDGVHLVHDQGPKVSESMALNLMNNQSEESTPVNQKTSHVENSISKRRHSAEPQASSLPHKRPKEGGLFGACQQVQIDRMLMAPDIRTEYQLYNSLPIWKPTTKKRSNTGAARTVGRKTNYVCENVENMMQPLNLEVVIGETDRPAQVVEDKLAINVSSQPIVVGLPVTDSINFSSGKSMVERACVSGSIAANNLSSDRETRLTLSTTPKKDERSSEADSMKSRRKEKPISSPIKHDDLFAVGNSQSRDSNLKSTDKDSSPCSVSEKVMTVMDDVSTNQEKMPLGSPGYKIQQTTEKGPTETHDENSDGETLIAALRRRRPSKSCKTCPQVNDYPKASREKTITKTCDAAADTVVKGVCDLKFCDGPLLQCTMETSSIRSLNLETPKDKCMENGKTLRDGELLQEDNLESNQQPSASFKENDEPALPFVKNNDLWKTIESMEAFKKIPQKPHFRPLGNFPERSRQGLAIGLMVTCATVMEEVLNLRLSDPKSITDSIVETLADLETHGFDVKVVKDCVNSFAAIKDKQHNHLEEVKSLEDRISEREVEKRKNSEEFGKIKEQIQKLQVSLILIEYADAEAVEEISYLKTKLQETIKEINDVEREFEASKSW